MREKKPKPPRIPKGANVLMRGKLKFDLGDRRAETPDERRDRLRRLRDG